MDPGRNGGSAGKVVATQSVRKTSQDSNTGNLDGQGQSCLLYPGTDGRYEAPMAHFPCSSGRENAGSSQTESSDTKDLEELITSFNKLARPQPISPMEVSQHSPLPPGGNVRNTTQYSQRQSYASNIANIVKSTNVVSSPSALEGGKAVEHSTMLGFGKINSGFPRDVFQVNTRAKRQLP